MFRAIEGIVVEKSCFPLQGGKSAMVDSDLGSRNLDESGVNETGLTPEFKTKKPPRAEF